ncbi:hypothetical protein [Pseudomonas syringae]
MKIKIKSAAQIKSFPAEAGPTVEVAANPTVRMRCLCRTGFSREEASSYSIDFDPETGLVDHSHALRGNVSPGALR